MWIKGLFKAMRTTKGYTPPSNAVKPEPTPCPPGGEPFPGPPPTNPKSAEVDSHTAAVEESNQRNLYAATTELWVCPYVRSHCRKMACINWKNSKAEMFLVSAHDFRYYASNAGCSVFHKWAVPPTE